jgi:RNA polymerase sigma-70 factor (ECF subfamily)
MSMGNIFQSLFAAKDEQLMWRVKLDDDPQAFAGLVARWEKPIRRLCERMTGDPHRAEDLTQMAFARVFARRADWQPVGRFSTFLWRVALNLCHDESRKISRRGECSLDALEEEENGNVWPVFTGEGDPGPDALTDARERGELVRQALQKLAPQHREVVVLRHYERLKFHEIGSLLGIPEGTVKSRMAEALTHLGRLLRHLNEDLSCNPKNQTRELQIL